MPTPYLITIPFSHYCEKARWGLAHAGVRFSEEGHLPFFHVMPVKQAGGRRTVPVLVTDDGVLDDSTLILRWADKKAAEGRGLYGDSPEERRDIDALASTFDEDLGPATRRWIYFHLLPHRPAMLDLVRVGVPSWERAALTVGLPVARAILRKAMNITPEGAERSRRKIAAVFDSVAARIADGRRYLIGARLSAADLTFAALASPAVMPARYGAYLPPLEAFPKDAAAQIRTWRSHPAGQLALRLYEEHR